jgi:arsenate reductase (glutaredoxin)
MVQGKITIYHNPRCSKSRETLALIEEKGIKPLIIEYLKNPPSENELRELLHKLGLKPWDIVRKSEPLYKEKLGGKPLKEEAWIRVLVKHPALIERPIVVKDNEAILGRPPQNVLKLLPGN